MSAVERATKSAINVKKYLEPDELKEFMSFLKQRDDANHIVRYAKLKLAEHSAKAYTRAFLAGDMDAQGEV